MAWQPLNALRKLLFGDIALKRRSGRVQVSFGPDTVAPAAAAKARTAPQDDCEPLRAALKAVLGVHPGTRKVLRHLAAVEAALRGGGMVALKRLPAPVLAEALAQLEGVVADWSRPGLGALRRCLQLECMSADEAAPTQPLSDVHPSDFHAASRLQVSDATESEFLALSGGGPGRA